MTDEIDLVRLHTVQGWDVAQIYKSKLEAADIPVLLKYEALGPVIGITVDGLGAVEILVPREYAADAAELLEEADVDASLDSEVPDEPGESS
jgi:hypothetical protein